MRFPMISPMKSHAVWLFVAFTCQCANWFDPLGSSCRSISSSHGTLQQISIFFGYELAYDRQISTGINDVWHDLTSIVECKLRESHGFPRISRYRLNVFSISPKPIEMWCTGLILFVFVHLHRIVEVVRCNRSHQAMIDENFLSAALILAKEQLEVGDFVNLTGSPGACWGCVTMPAPVGSGRQSACGFYVI